MMNRERRLDDTGSTRRALEMTNVGLHRSNAHRLAARATALAHRGLKTLDLNLVAHHSTGAVTLDQVDFRWMETRLSVCPLQRELLAPWVGSSDALSSSV